MNLEGKFLSFITHPERVAAFRASETIPPQAGLDPIESILNKALEENWNARH